jgi:hypothetical protein
MLEAEVREWCQKHAMEFPPIVERIEIKEDVPKAKWQIIAAETEPSGRLRNSRSMAYGTMAYVRFPAERQVRVDGREIYQYLE